MWNGLIKIIEIKHQNKFGEIIWERKNIPNLLHLRGEEFILRSAFTGGKISDVIPENYYIGLDNRSLIVDNQEMSDISGEPSFSGYTRQAIASSGDFTVALENGHYQAISPIMVFTANGGSWGPVSVLFLTDSSDSSGTLISSIVLDTPIILNDGESVTLRFGASLKDC